MEIYEFYNLGLGEPFAVSSVHGLGVGDLLDEVVANLPEPENLGEDDDVIKIAVIGKPNVGKSSLVNKILGENRAIVSEIAGTTRDAIDSEFERNNQKYVIIDTAGMRKRGKIEEDIERFSVVRALAAVDRSDVCLIMINAEEGVTEQDTKVAGYAHEQGKACVIAVNKWDLIEKDNHTFGEYKKRVMEGLAYMTYAPIMFISALTGQRVEQMFDVINSAVAENAKRISTGILNDCIADAVAMVQPPSDKGKRLKIYYATQADAKPPTFVLFVNKAQLAHFSYIRYLENRLRDTFGFEGTPIRFSIRERGEQ